MDIDISQFLLVMILVILFSILIGYSIIFLIDKKLSNITITIPPMPKPNIIINIDKNGKLKSNRSKYGNISNDRIL